MAVIFWLFTVVFLLVGGWANYFIWEATNGAVSAWDFETWPILFHNIWINPFDFPQMVYTLAIVGPLLAGLLLLGKIIKALIRLAAAPRPARTKDKKPNAKTEAVEDKSIWKAAPTPDQVQENTRAKKEAGLLTKLGQAGGVIKEAFGNDFDAWKIKRLKQRGEATIETLKGEDKGFLKSFFKRPEKKTVSGNFLTASNDGAVIMTRDPNDEIVFEIMAWYAAWQLAGMGKRTMAMEEKASDLKKKLTQEISNLVTEKHQHAGLSALEALYAATMYEKGIGGFSEDAAETVEQPSEDELIDPEIQGAGAGFEDDGPTDDDLSDKDEDQEEVPTEFKRQSVNPEAMREFFDRYKPAEPKKSTESEEDALADFKRAGSGSADEFLGALGGNSGWQAPGELAEDGKRESGEEGQPAEMSAGSDEFDDWQKPRASGSGEDWGEFGASPSGNSPSEGEQAPEDGSEIGRATHEDDPSWMSGDLPTWKEPEGESSAPVDDEMPAGIAWEKWGSSPKSTPSHDGDEGNIYSSPSRVDNEATSRAGFDEWASTPHEAPKAIHGDDHGIVGSQQNATEEEGAVSALLASVSPDGPIKDFTDEDLKERPEDIAIPVSTVIPPEEISRTIRKMDKNWLRFVTGEVDKTARALERQFIQAGLADLTSRNVFIPALWEQLNKVVDYQTQAYAWEHFGDVPPENLRTAKQRAEFLFDAVTGIVALAKQVPEADLGEISRLKAGTEQVRWLSAGRAERMVAELKRTGAVEPKKVELPDEPRIAPTPASEPVVSQRRMAEVAETMAAGNEWHQPATSMTETAPSWSDDDLREPAEDGNEGNSWTPGTDTGAPAETPKAEVDLLASLEERARKDGLHVRKGMRFKATQNSTASDEERTLDLVFSSSSAVDGRVPVGRSVIAILCVDVPEGQWHVSKGENGRPQLKWAGQVIELRTWSFRLFDTFMKGRDDQPKNEEIRKFLFLRMDPLAMIEDAEGHTDKDAVIHALEEGVSVRTQDWTAAEWREQVVLPALS